MPKKLKLVELVENVFKEVKESFNAEEIELTILPVAKEDESLDSNREFVVGIFNLTNATSIQEFQDYVANEDNIKQIATKVALALLDDKENDDVSEVELDENEIEELRSSLKDVISFIYSVKIASEIMKDEDVENSIKEEIQTVLATYDDILKTEVNKEGENLSEEKNAEGQKEINTEFEKEVERSSVEQKEEENIDAAKELENAAVENEEEAEKEDIKENENAASLDKYGDVIKVETQDGETVEIEFIHPEKAISDKPWGQVDKTELRRFIIDLAQKAKDANVVKRIANMMFGLVRCVDSPDCLKFPFAELRNKGKGKYAVLINRNGVKSAVVFLAMPNTKSAIKKDERVEIASKLLKVYELLKEPAPASLTKLVNNQEDSITIALKDENLIYEIANKLELPIEEVVDILQALNGTIEALYKAGYIDIAATEEDVGNYIVINTADEFIKIFKKFQKLAPGIVNALNSEDFNEEVEDSVIYEYDRLKQEYARLVEENAKLEEELKNAADTIKELQNEVNSLKETLDSLTLLKEKYNLLIELATNSGLSHIVDELSEISNAQELEYFKKYKVDTILKTTDNSANLRKKLKVRFTKEDESVLKWTWQKNSANVKAGDEYEEYPKTIIDLVKDII